MRSTASWKFQAVCCCLILLSAALSAEAQEPTSPDEALQPIPRAQTQPETTPAPTARRTRSSNTYNSLLSDYRRGGNNSRRLANTPAMFGDFLNIQVIRINTNTEYVEGKLPIAGGAGPLKIADNNMAMPKDRVFFYYNRFQNALGESRAPSSSDPFQKFHQLSVDRYTIGFEKTFLCEQWSVELRAPVTGRERTNDSDYRLGGGNMGNLSLILKRLIYESDCAAVALGMGIETPTGSNVSIEPPGFNYDVRVHNQAFHLHPYLGFVARGDNPFFWQGFAQFDFATNGNSVKLGGPTAAGFSPTTGVLNPSNFFHVDLSSGVWLYRDPCASIVTGLATLVEIHYTTAINDADQVTFPSFLPSLGSQFNRYNGANLTFGVHTEIVNRTHFRVAGALPLHSSRRFFDSEILVSLIREF